MKVAVAVVMQRDASSDEADFTSEEELTHMTTALHDLRHEVCSVDFSAPLAEIAARIEADDPDVIFNTVEQVRGEPRPAGLIPTICRALGRPCTGPGPRAITIGSDKWLTKRVASAGPVPFARDTFVSSDRPLDLDHLDGLYPVIAKPNFGGSSQGITADSIARAPAEALEAVARLGPFLDAGIIVEEFIPGRDITVGCVQANGAWRVLAPIEYATPASDSQHFLTEHLKRWEGWDDVIPRRADLSPDHLHDLEAHVLGTVQTVGANGVARVDFRLSEADDRLYALEINAIANVEPGAGLVLSAEHAGLGYLDLIALMLASVI
jgi:D-alanine-D-alanine ligase-like ATP-grasp enzyme